MSVTEELREEERSERHIYHDPLQIISISLHGQQQSLSYFQSSALSNMHTIIFCKNVEINGKI